MPSRIELSISSGIHAGESYQFTDHDSLIFGRAEHCHIKMPPDDNTVSRSHFLLEVNPPDARIRDLGSLNGTYLNGIKYGGREQGETPEQGASKRYPEVDLQDGDRIQAGNTEFLVKVELQNTCSICHEHYYEQAVHSSSSTSICPSCRNKLMNQPPKPDVNVRQKPIVCKKCGKDIKNEVRNNRKGDYICQSCQQKILNDPDEFMNAIIHIYNANKRDKNTPIIDGYKLGNRIGEGGFGAVYQATRKTDKLPVAIKVMLSQVAVEEHCRKQFLREIEVQAALKHKNIVEIMDYGNESGIFYFVMQYCNGGSLHDLITKSNGKVPIDVALPIMIDSLEGLAYAHSHDIVHRDIKPSNILLNEYNGRSSALICDMGLAKNFENAGLSGLSRTGSKAGTPIFMPKEQAINFKYIKPVSDVWSIGATFYVMLTGAMPRPVKRGEDVWQAILSDNIIPIRERDKAIPKKIADVVDKSLVINTSIRYSDAGEFLKALKSAM